MQLIWETIFHQRNGKILRVTAMVVTGNLEAWLVSKNNQCSLPNDISISAISLQIRWKFHFALIPPPPPPHTHTHTHTHTKSSTWHDGNFNYPFDLNCDFKRNCYRNGPKSYITVSHGTQCCTILATCYPIRCQVICSHSGGLGKTVNPLTAGNTWVCIQHCGYWCSGAKAPGHQYPQCWLIINCFGEVSYRNITVKGNYIRK